MRRREWKVWRGESERRKGRRKKNEAHGLNTPVPLSTPSPGMYTSFILPCSLLFVLFLGQRKEEMELTIHTLPSDRLGRKQHQHPHTHWTSSLMDHAYCTHTLTSIYNESQLLLVSCPSFFFFLFISHSLQVLLVAYASHQHDAFVSSFHLQLSVRKEESKNKMDVQQTGKPTTK